MTSLTDRITEATLQHLPFGGNHCDWCNANWTTSTNVEDAAHLASVLVPLVETAQAEAWDEGVAAGHWEYGETQRIAHPTYIGKRELPKAPNPYRKGTP